MCRTTSSSSAAPPAVLSHSQSPSGVVTDTTVRVVVGPVLCQPQALHPQTVLLPSGGQACRFCPSNPHRLAVAASQLFGICGKGQLLVVDFGNNTTPQRAVVRTTGRTADVPHGRQGKSVPFRLGETQAHWASVPFVASDVQNGAAFAALESVEAAARRDEALRDAAAEGPLPNVRTTAVLTTRDAIHDCAWSFKQANILAAACGDGAVRVWNIPLESPLQFYAHGSFAYTAAGRSAATHSAGLHVAAEITAHQAEVCTVDWSPRHPQVLLSASWDATARLWDLLRPSQHVLRCLRHPQCVYAAQFSPHLAAVIASVSADGRLRIFDLHMPPRKIFTGATDGSVSSWDIRQFAAGPLLRLRAHSLAVRAVRCSPFDQAIVATASYDTTVKIHHLVTSNSTHTRGLTSPLRETIGEGTSEQQGSFPVSARLLPASTAVSRPPSRGAFPCSFVRRTPTVFAHHTEFVLGLDWSPFCPHLLASTSWDRKLCLWNVSYRPGRPMPRACSQQPFAPRLPDVTAA